VLGATWVRRRGDPALALAARDLVAKLAAAVPERLRPYVLEPAAGTPPRPPAPPDGLDLARLRAAIHAGHKLRLDYRDEQGRSSQRVIWPVAVGYLEQVRMVIGWCELRRDFRHFRADRVTGATFLDERYPDRPAALRARWKKSLTWKGGRPVDADGR
jgi:predicted DNA-binding transcriptional regulator YafY